MSTQPTIYGAGVGDIRAWLRTAGRVTLEDAGEQAALFGPPVKVYRCVSRSAGSLLLTEEQIAAYNLRGIVESQSQGALFD